MSETPRRYSAEELKDLIMSVREGDTSWPLGTLEDDIANALSQAAEDAARLEQIATCSTCKWLQRPSVDLPKVWGCSNAKSPLWMKHFTHEKIVQVSCIFHESSSAGRREETEGR